MPGPVQLNALPLEKKLLPKKNEFPFAPPVLGLTKAKLPQGWEALLVQLWLSGRAILTNSGVQ